MQFQLEQVFVAWIESGPRSDQVPVLSGGRHPHDAGTVRDWPISAVLYELWDDRRPVPAGPASELGLPPGSSFAHAARLLWCLCEDDLFPTRTHVQAVRYLRALPADVAATYHRAIAEALERSDPEPGHGHHERPSPPERHAVS